METFQQSFLLGLSVWEPGVSKKLGLIHPPPRGSGTLQRTGNALPPEPAHWSRKSAGCRVFLYSEHKRPPRCLPFSLSAHQEEEIASILSVYHSHTGFSPFLQQQPYEIGRYCYFIPIVCMRKRGTGSTCRRSHGLKQPRGLQPMVHRNHRLRGGGWTLPPATGALLSSCGQAPCWP